MNAPQPSYSIIILLFSYSINCQFKRQNLKWTPHSRVIQLLFCYSVILLIANSRDRVWNEHPTAELYRDEASGVVLGAHVGLPAEGAHGDGGRVQLRQVVGEPAVDVADAVNFEGPVATEGGDEGGAEQGLQERSRIEGGREKALQEYKYKLRYWWRNK